MRCKLREPVSGLTHLAGAVLSVVGTVFLIAFAVSTGTPLNIASVSIFGASLILLYTASSLYHLLTVSKKAIGVLRRIDHMMIYVLIAGTYTPLCLIGLKGKLGLGLLIGVWSLAVLGIVLKLVWFNAPRWIYTSFYLIMGWLVIIAIIPLIKMIPSGGIWLLVAGGVFYTIGAVIYGAKWPFRKNNIFGFHEIFHIFVMLGSLFHYFFVLEYLT
ncbi:PAQR family membrane homeostasis protein TrhA [Lutispora saccharofermentans]|uniref:Hemolysin III family protein n=1 Tax=Lutispora saccharofermentans TaxID=3024236 RepID=A0ABT1NIA0_9FIRM|nr:hemolysin III family protein [Lutispora saccharofermentans]MCQ1530031.1 hemolysin III family protein [Lutispora saccharofermentans]